ncbi:LrgB family protein [Methanosarcina horonobensis]|uniref:LrgB family protein n=1 Tax=Methanosarcina horonobensis TaxID=418008 RepID=UPI000A5E0D0E|nr:LrgB family protein [Methanosarcina horonobensis]
MPFKNLYFRIDFETYNLGGDYISFFLGPSTVVLAVPLYKKIQLLKSDVLPIIAGISAGYIAGISSILILSNFFGLDKIITSSLVPKSVTTPIGIEISKQIGGLPAITVAAIVATGIIGAVLGPFICRSFRIKDSVAVGIAIGTASHALGTTRAIELGETEGAMSGLQ